MASCAGSPPAKSCFGKVTLADRLFVVLSGRLKVSVTESSGEVLELATVGPGGYVGEVGLLDGGPRSASVQSPKQRSYLRWTERHFCA